MPRKKQTVKSLEISVKKNKKLSGKRAKRYWSSALRIEDLKAYEWKLRTHLKETSLFLKPELSLEMLSQETKIPKHHFSQLFNTYIGKSYYQLIAEYRIKYAIELLNQDNDHFTIESLAYECGFNSKTSFNKYFKEQTGYTPSSYRESKLMQCSA